MTVFVLEFEGNCAAAATEAGKKFLSGDTLLEALRHMTDRPLEAVPNDLAISYGQHSPEVFEAIKADWGKEVAAMGPLANGLSIDEIAPAWAVIEARSLDADNGTFRLRQDGQVTFAFSGVEL